MSFETTEEITKVKQGSQKDSRRTFLKKAVYAAPTVVALGALLKPTESEAFTKPPSTPNW